MTTLVNRKISIIEIQEFLNERGLDVTYSISNTSLSIKKFSTLDEFFEQSILWIKNMDDFLHDKHNVDWKNVLIISNQVIDKPNYNSIASANSKEVFFELIQHFFTVGSQYHISEHAEILTDNIGENVSIGSFTFIDKDVVIGNHVIIKDNVSILGKVTIGDHTYINSGAVIGSEGYGYYKDSSGINKKVPHLAGVMIGKHVDIGANTCIDRGTLTDTIIEDYVKIDNLCHIAHNVHIEENVNVIALSMIAGSVRLKKDAYIAPSSSVRNQLTIGKNALVGLGAVVVKNVEDNQVVSGVPAKPMKKIINT